MADGSRIGISSDKIWAEDVSAVNPVGKLSGKILRTKIAIGAVDGDLGDATYNNPLPVGGGYNSSVKTNAGALSYGQTLVEFESNGGVPVYLGPPSPSGAVASGTYAAGPTYGAVCLWSGTLPNGSNQKNLFITDMSFTADEANSAPIGIQLVAGGTYVGSVAGSTTYGVLTSGTVIWEGFVSVTTPIDVQLESQETVPYGTPLYLVFLNYNSGLPVGTSTAPAHLTYDIAGFLQ